MRPIHPAPRAVDGSHQVLIVGGGAAGIAVAASLLSRDPHLDVAIIDPADTHYYQPGWTLVGAGVFSAESTRRDMASLMPKGSSGCARRSAASSPSTMPWCWPTSVCWPMTS